MKRIIYLIAAVSLFASCSTARKATTTAHTVSAETTETQRDEYAERETTQTTETHADTDMIVTTTIDEYDTTQPADPVTGTPPLKRRETITAQKRAKETTTTETTTTERESVAVETKTATQTECTQETTDEIQPPQSRGWRGFKAGVLVALAAGSLGFALKNKIKNLLKPY